MRYPTESDFSQDRVYSSSRLAPEEIPLGNEDSQEEIHLADGSSDRPIPTMAAVVPQTATSIPSNPPASVAKRESSKKRKEGSNSDKEKRTPSFFSRSYIAWRNLANRGVFTPVSPSSDPLSPSLSVALQGLIVFPQQPVVSPLQDAVCRRLRKLSIRDYLILGNRILRDHFE
jgi:hypothetical protein